MIRIGNDISLMIVEIRGDKVRIGIDAPKETQVHREEIWLRIQNGEKPSCTDQKPQHEGNASQGDAEAVTPVA